MRQDGGPDLEGAAGRAWELEPGEKTLAYWAIHAPGQAGFWDKFIVAALDLEGPPAPLDGRKASRDFPDARWEIACWALDPTFERAKWPAYPNTVEGHLGVLHPQNVRVQLPDHPAELIADATRAVVAAALVPIWGLYFEPRFRDDQTDAWRAVLEATIEHPHHHGERT